MENLEENSDNAILRPRTKVITLTSISKWGEKIFFFLNLSYRERI